MSFFSNALQHGRNGVLNHQSFEERIAMPALPKTIYKYEGFNLQSLHNLKAQSVYFASPRQFNDPYDCTITAHVAEPTAEEIEMMRRCYLNRPDLQGDARLQIESIA